MSKHESIVFFRLLTTYNFLRKAGIDIKADRWKKRYDSISFLLKHQILMLFWFYRLKTGKQN